MKKLLTIVLVLPLVACAGGPAATPRVAPTPTPPPSVTAATLRESCAEAEAALKGFDIVMDGDVAVRSAAAKVQVIANAGDQETKNALAYLVDAIKKGENASVGVGKLNASQGYLSALDIVANRCKAVGSSAFQ